MVNPRALFHIPFFSKAVLNCSFCFFLLGPWFPRHLFPPLPLLLGPSPRTVFLFRNSVYSRFKDTPRGFPLRDSGFCDVFQLFDSAYKSVVELLHDVDSCIIERCGALCRRIFTSALRAFEKTCCRGSVGLRRCLRVELCGWLQVGPLSAMPNNNNNNTNNTTHTSLFRALLTQSFFHQERSDSFFIKICFTPRCPPTLHAVV